MLSISYVFNKFSLMSNPIFASVQVISKQMPACAKRRGKCSSSEGIKSHVKSRLSYQQLSLASGNTGVFHVLHYSFWSCQFENALLLE